MYDHTWTSSSAQWETEGTEAPDRSWLTTLAERVSILGTYNDSSQSWFQKQKRIEKGKTGFFVTSTAEKTKTQGQNSSKKLKEKLKEKTQPLGATLLKFVKTQEKKSFSQISRGTPKYTIFIAKYFQKKGTFWNF